MTVFRYRNLHLQFLYIFKTFYIAHQLQRNAKGLVGRLQSNR